MVEAAAVTLDQLHAVDITAVTLDALQVVEAAAVIASTDTSWLRPR